VKKGFSIFTWKSCLTTISIVIHPNIYNNYFLKSMFKIFPFLMLTVISIQKKTLFQKMNNEIHNNHLLAIIDSF